MRKALLATALLLASCGGHVQPANVAPPAVTPIACDQTCSAPLEKQEWTECADPADFDHRDPREGETCKRKEQKCACVPQRKPPPAAL